MAAMINANFQYVFLKCYEREVMKNNSDDELSHNTIFDIASSECTIFKLLIPESTQFIRLLLV